MPKSMLPFNATAEPIALANVARMRRTSTDLASDLEKLLAPVAPQLIAGLFGEL
ncbi:hypothetical protein HPDFL43_00039790 [Hoeflea phototrophica DFL-43]|uniref:Uncharacterized protein n=1 Tax=Hoeflea phototrophica (strain DSM 17068 / NCIMB 14078 / DFL-43) TaxID=411684 RepID=A0A094YYK8_HOEPD|nr:hypothetical protein HPDFL43_00039790 [Hoeflea phototrophica DFL-43]